MLCWETIAIYSVLLELFEVQGLLATHQSRYLFDVKQLLEQKRIDKATHTLPKGIQSRLSLLQDIKLNEKSDKLFPVRLVYTYYAATLL